jgi:molybdopterin-containing oxidoreductase family membrane subunit
MRELSYFTIDGRNVGGWVILIGLCALVGMGGLAALYMEHNGHWVTGMTNNVVWGLPHVYALFLLVAASGALNVASIGSVFGKEPYKPFGRLSCLLAISLLAGGLAVLLLDLGRSDRLMVAMTHLNFTSIFAFNIILYSGFFAFVAAYLWVMMDPRMKVFYKPVAVGAFLWRLILTTGSGSVFGFLVSRTAYHTAILAPTFIALSLSVGLACFLVVVLALDFVAGRPKLPDDLRKRISVLLPTLTAVTLYMVVVLHLTNFYSAERRAVERFLLLDGGIYTTVLWVGFVGLGSLLPIAMTLTLGNRSKLALFLSALLVNIGGLCLMYVVIVGGEAFPIEIFPGKLVSSSFFDGAVNSYVPSLVEFVLAVGGVGVAGLLLVVGLWALPLLPDLSAPPSSLHPGE